MPTKDYSSTPTTLMGYLSQIDNKSILQDLAGLFKLSTSQVQNAGYYLPSLKGQITLTNDSDNATAILSLVQEIDPSLAWFTAIELLLDSRDSIIESALAVIKKLPFSSYPYSDIDIAIETDPATLKRVLLSHPDDVIKIAAIQRSKELLTFNQLYNLLIRGSICFSEDVLYEGISAIDEKRSSHKIKFVQNVLWKNANESRPKLIKVYFEDILNELNPMELRKSVYHTLRKAYKHLDSQRFTDLFSYFFENRMNLISKNILPDIDVSSPSKIESSSISALLYGFTKYLRNLNAIIPVNNKKSFNSFGEFASQCLSSTIPSIRLAAFQCRLLLTPSKVLGLAHQMLDDENDEIQQLSISLLKQHGSKIDANHIFEFIKKNKHSLLDSKSIALTQKLLSLDWKTYFHEIVFLINYTQLFVSNRSTYTRRNILLLISKCVPQADYRRSLYKLIQSDDNIIRLTAFKLLSEPYSEKELRNWAVKTLIRPMCFKCFSNDFPRKEWALKLLEGVTDPTLLPLILPWAHYDAVEMRTLSLKTMIGIDDILVFSELVASLNDIEPEVREIAEDLLFETPDKVAILRRLNEMGKLDPVNEVKEKVLAINRWAVDIAFKLTGKQATISQYIDGIGRTWWNTGKQTMKIEISEKPVTTFHKYGEEIMRGIALHEIGHHLCDIGVRGARTMRGIANSEGCNEIFDILLDERLERVLRSKKPEWGIYFDRLSSYVFNSNSHVIPVYEIAKRTGKSSDIIKSVLLSGKLPGDFVPATKANPFDSIKLRDIELLTFPYPLVSITMVFLSFARCGFAASLHSDPRIKDAISMIPSNLKDLRHADVLKVAKQIASVLGIKNSDEYRRERKELKDDFDIIKEGEISDPYPGNREATPLLTCSINKILQRVDATMHNLDMGKKKVRNTPKRNPYKNYSPKSKKVIESDQIEKDDNLENDTFGGQFVNIGDSIDFNSLTNTVIITSEPEQDAELILPLRNHIIRLRSFFENLSKSEQDEYASRRGKRLDYARLKKVLVAPGLNILVSSTQHNIKSDAYIGILIDRSSSMHGEKLTLAKSFAALLVESIGTIHGIEGHVNAFDENTFYKLGTLTHCSVAGLYAGGGNNDAGALKKAAELAMASRKKNKLLVMISDGSPTECTEISLTSLVQQLESSYQIKCIQVAIDKFSTASFKDFVDLSNLDFHSAITRFGEIIARITAEWR